MAAVGSQVSVGTSATRLDTQTSGGMGRSSILIRNKGTNTVDIGGSGVTAGAGFQLATNEAVTVDITTGDAGIYGIVASATSTVHVLQVGG